MGDFLQPFIQCVAKSMKFTNYDAVINHVKNHVSPNNSSLYRVTVKSGKKNLKLLFKEAPCNIEYANEAAFYKFIFPALSKLVSNTKKTHGKELPIPLLYNFWKTSNRNIFAFDDLEAKGFQPSRFKIIANEKHIEKMLLACALYHGVSFACKTLNKDYSDFQKAKAMVFSDFHSKEIIDYFGPSSEQDKQTALLTCQQLCFISNKTFKYETLMNLNEKIPRTEMYKKCLYLTEAVTRYKGEYVCFIHGSSVMSNMMFKYSELDPNIPETVYMVDWKRSRWGTPICDLSTLLYSAAPNSLLENDLQTYLDFYYKVLSKTIELFDLSSEDVFPYWAFQADWAKYHPSGLFRALSVFIGKNVARTVGDISKNDINKFYDNPAYKDYNESYIYRLQKISEAIENIGK